MAPKTHRTGHLRAHSRTSSSTKIGANLAFTQNPAKAAAGVAAGRKSSASGLHEPQPRAGAHQYQRANSAVRVHQLQSQEQNTRQASPRRSNTPNGHKSTGTKTQTGFTIDAEDDEDDGDWVSSESGAATPNAEAEDSDEETASSTHTGTPRDVSAQRDFGRQVAAAVAAAPPPLTRTDTLKPSKDYEPKVKDFQVSPEPQQAKGKTLTPIPAAAQRPPAIKTHVDEDMVRHVPTTARTAPSSPHRNHHQHKSSKASRPPSMHSIASHHPQPQLRPHPLIRGHSYGQGALAARPVALTAVQDAEQGHTDQNGSSPTATVTSTPSPSSPRPLSFISSYSPTASRSDRRTSISSSHSIATLPAPHKGLFDRARTLSTMSTNSSSTALSSLAQAHHPSYPTRPPTPQLVSFFPAQNPHAHIDEIHPLLPTPYLTNHLTTLASRTPLRESFDRVIAAKRGAQTALTKV